MKSKLFVVLLVVFFIYFDQPAKATVECHGGYSNSYYFCSDTAYSCSSVIRSEYYPCDWFQGKCVSWETLDNHCSGGDNIGTVVGQCEGTGGGSGCSANVCPTYSGCWTCDTNECKPGTTSYTQSCGSTTLNYSCTNECGGTKSWTGVGSCKECKTDTNCGLNPRDCGADYCQHCARTVSDWTPACGDQTRTCTDNDGSCDGDDCLGVSLSQCQECRTISPWSSCGDDHKRTRTCTDYCGGCVGVDLVEDCVGTITGTLFDASDLASCPDNIGTNAAYSSIRFANEVFGINPVTAGKWPVISAPVASDANGNYSERVYASATVPALYDFDFSTILASDRVAGVKFQCQTNQAAVTSQDQVVRKDIGFWRVYGGWWQVVGGSVYAAEGIESTIPASLLPMTDQVLILPNANGRDGLLSHGTAWQRTELGTNPNVQVSNSLRRIRSLYGGLRYDYNFYKTRMDIFTKTAWDGGAVTYSDGGKGYQIFTHTGNVTLNALSLTGSQKAIFLVDGDVTISGNILSPVGTFMGIISSGKITVRPWVTDVQGWVVAETIDIPCEDANSNGVCDKTDVQFKGEGSFVAWTDMNFDRDQYKVNNTQPSEKFVYRNDFLLNVPAPMKVYTRKFTPFVP